MLKMADKCICDWGSAPDPAGGGYSALPRPQIKGPDF